LLYDRDIETEEYIIHDNANLLSNPGSACRVPRALLSRLSNGRGIMVDLAHVSRSAP
jgi:hypothetical protein